MVFMQNVVIGEDTGDKLHSQVIHMLFVAEIVKYCVLAVGCLLVFSACLVLAVFLCRRRCHSVTNSLCFWLDVVIYGRPA